MANICTMFACVYSANSILRGLRTWKELMSTENKTRTDLITTWQRMKEHYPFPKFIKRSSIPRNTDLDCVAEAHFKINNLKSSLTLAANARKDREKMRTEQKKGVNKRRNLGFQSLLFASDSINWPNSKLSGQRKSKLKSLVSVWIRWIHKGIGANQVHV